MSKNYTPALKTEADDDAIEPEIVSGPSRGSYGSHKAKSPMGRIRAFIFKIKVFFAVAIGLIALTLIIIGAVLTSTVIGAVLGIPLMLFGVFLIWLLLKVLTLGSKENFVVFNSAPRHRQGHTTF